MTRPRLILALLPLLCARALPAAAPTADKFFEQHCYDCHDKESKKGGLDLTELKPDFANTASFTAWMKVHDRIESGEMPPPKKKKRPPAAESAQITTWLDNELTAADNLRHAAEGRAVIRRITRVEYENALRDLLAMPDLRLIDLLPADGQRGGYDKLGEALDLSHVQLAKYLETAEYALNAATATRPEAPPVLKTRIYPGSDANMCKALGTGNAVLLKNFAPDPLYPAPGKLMAQDYIDSFGLAKKAGVPTSKSAAGFFHPNVVYLQTGYGFAPIFPGKYRLRTSLWSFMWNAGAVEPSPKTEVAMLYLVGRTLGYFDAPSLKPLVTEITPWLEKGDEVYFNCASLHLHEQQVRMLAGGAAGYTGPGIATDWLDVEGPLFDQWPPESHHRLFGNLPIKPFDSASGAHAPKRTPATDNNNSRSWPRMTDLPPSESAPPLCTVVSDQPLEDATRLLKTFLSHAFRRPAPDDEVRRYVGLVQARLNAKDCFEDALNYAYKAALTSTNFLFRVESPGKLDDLALASRLSFWLWNSVPDDDLLALANAGRLHQPEVMRTQVERLLSDPRSERFINDFLDQWLKLRDIDSTDPDGELYPEYHVYLKDSMLAESRAFFRELVVKDLSVTNVVASDFAMMNGRLADHYGFEGVSGSKIHATLLPPNCERGGLITQASVLKVSANGTNTSPVIRGVWFNERILGLPVPPPPPGIPAIDPDTHGATTVREQLEKHRADPSCASCHAKMDPPGFALECFDVIGRFRTRYRSRGAGVPTNVVYPGGWKPTYKLGPVVDSAGQLPDGRAFNDIIDLRKHLLADPDQIARNLAQQLLTYATGAELSYADRREISQLVAESKQRKHGVRSLIHIIAQSSLFQRK